MHQNAQTFAVTCITTALSDASVIAIKVTTMMPAFAEREHFTGNDEILVPVAHKQNGVCRLLHRVTRMYEASTRPCQPLHDRETAVRALGHAALWKRFDRFLPRLQYCRGATGRLPRPSVHPWRSVFSFAKICQCTNFLPHHIYKSIKDITMNFGSLIENSLIYSMKLF